MSFLSMVEAQLPPGFRFHPRDDELICDYLAPKVLKNGGNGSFSGRPPMEVVDLNKCEPWELPDTACVVGGKEWYFFSLRDRKYATGQRTNRATISGYWKATGKDRAVARRGTVVGMRKTLVFYQGRAPKGRKTEWVMHEYRIEGGAHDAHTHKVSSSEDWALCRVLCKKRGATNKARMGNTNAYGDTCTSSPSLPSLIDTHINFGQTQIQTQTQSLNQINLDALEQVPCFSSFSTSMHTPYYTPTSLVSQFPMMDKCQPNTNSVQFETNATDSLGTYLDPYTSDKKVLKVVLSHLSKLEGNSKEEVVPNSVEGNLGGYLNEMALASSWIPF